LVKENDVKICPPGSGKKDVDAIGKIDLVNASFHYPTKPDVQVLDDVSIAIPEN